MTAQINKDKTSLDHESNDKPVLSGELANNKKRIGVGVVVRTDEPAQTCI